MIRAFLLNKIKTPRGCSSTLAFGGVDKYNKHNDCSFSVSHEAPRTVISTTKA